MYSAGAYCYAELGCMIQRSGADYAYIHFSFGPFLAFIRLWIECIILRPCIGAIQSLTFALYILKPFFPECDPPQVNTQSYKNNLNNSYKMYSYLVGF